jgi:hypothetical protein
MHSVNNKLSGQNHIRWSEGCIDKFLMEMLLNSMLPTISTKLAVHAMLSHSSGKERLFAMALRCPFGALSSVLCGSLCVTGSTHCCHCVHGLLVTLSTS